ncbi:MAG: citrate:H+ symporter [Lawsonibacter sp.]|nr:citrate:H+ symporter [Lawsonibacter sp.]
MNITLVAILMVVLIILAGFQKRVPMYLALLFIPVGAALCLGYSIPEISTSLLAKMNDSMASGGYLLLFAIIYFSMLTESGMFETMINGLMRLLGGRMNVILLMILTTAVALLCGLTAQITVTFLIIFPVLLPLYKKYGLSRETCFILCQTGLAVMMILPWSAGAINVSVVLGCEPQELASAASRMALCMIPGIIFQWCYYAYRHKKAVGSFKLEVVEDVEESTEKSDNQLRRPKLFWANLLVFVVLMVGLVAFKIPAYLVFMAGAAYMIIVNYPKDFGKIIQKNAARYVDTLLMMLGISVYLAIFMDMGMVKALGETLIAVFPSFLMQHLHIIMLVPIVIFVRYIPSRVYTTLYPVFMAVGAQFGLTGMAVIAPYLVNMTLATGSTPFNTANVVGCSLLELDLNQYCKHAVRIQTVTNIISIAFALIFGVIPLAKI